ncbi:DUF5681 domain-containing protein [Ancylobacter radicis]|uniref:DUF5681 domain-containing protein n=1 Tax=Ancylobacter radicis TaxID=2836179 RepID=A0ABS5R5C7_9HYPH|nr:DUF5681 domain-containing protein [Ancylobacter radicis]MBS9476875.1 hypothetical protein [Ancylobacter radicis]
MADRDESGKKAKTLSNEAVGRMKADVAYGVGYGKPPEHSRFQKGTSGNPSGGPRAKSTDLSPADLPTYRAILEGMQRTVRIREGDTVSEISTPQALVRALNASALKGDPRSLRLALQLAQATERQEAIYLREKIELAKNYKEMTSSAMHTALAAGKEPPFFLPHPDDVVIDERVGFRVVGPVDENEQKKLEEHLRFRDVLIMQDELDRRLAPTVGHPSGQPGGALLFAIALDQLVPKRFRLSDTEFTNRMLRYETCAKRALLKELYRAWQSLGYNLPRGYRFHNVERAREILGFGIDLAMAFNDGRIDVDKVSRAEPDGALEHFVDHWIDRINAAPR